MRIYRSAMATCSHIVQELRESRGGCPGLSVLTSLLVSVDVNYIEPCFGIGLSLSLICQLTSEDIKQHYLPTYHIIPSIYPDCPDNSLGKNIVSGHLSSPSHMISTVIIIIIISSSTNSSSTAEAVSSSPLSTCYRPRGRVSYQ